jgi:hypothetical protein
MQPIVDTLSKLSDGEIIERTERLALIERRATAVLVAHLAVLDARRLYLPQGYSSLFTYCTERLHLSEHGAYNRIVAARLSRRFPVILDSLSNGSLHLAAIRIVAPFLSDENCHELIHAVRFQSKRQVEEIVAALSSSPELAAVATKVTSDRPLTLALSSGDTRGDAAAPPTQSTEPTCQKLSAQVRASCSHFQSDATRPSAARHAPPGTMTPVASDLYKVQFTADSETNTLLRQAQELLAPRVQARDIGSVMKLALSLLVQKLMKERLGAPGRQGKVRPGNPASRHVPLHVRRAVWARDGGQCGFIGKSGRRCTERSGLQFHHFKPYAVGGLSTVDNVGLRCREHNAHEAEVFFRGSSAPSPRRPPNSPRGEFGRSGKFARVPD